MAIDIALNQVISIMKQGPANFLGIKPPPEITEIPARIEPYEAKLSVLRGSQVVEKDLKYIVYIAAKHNLAIGEQVQIDNVVYTITEIKKFTGLSGDTVYQKLFI